MIWQTMPTLFLGVLALVSISEAANTTVTSTNSTTECVPADRTKQSAVQSESGVCLPYKTLVQVLQVKTGYHGYCEDIIGYLPVYGSNVSELYVNEMKMYRYRALKTLLEQSRRNSADGKLITNGNSYNVRQSCLDMVDHVYCHHYFKRCYISSSPQFLCREACEKMVYKVCDREFKIVREFVKSPHGPYSFDIINCTTLPFRNESSNCYYPDEIRDKLNDLESENCIHGDGRGYRGNRNVTVSGYTCQSWNVQCPHKHNINGNIYKAIRDSGNLCRNPGGLAKDGPWCFTTNRTVRWEYCDVPKCAKQPPSSPPVDFQGHNVSSTSINVTWGDVPKPLIHGILLGFHVTCASRNSSDRHFVDLAPAVHYWAFRGLEKFRNYTCWLRAYNNFGNGTWSEELVISTDEDVPDAPPGNLTAWNLSSTSLRVQWNAIPFGYRHGNILRYKVEIKAEEQTRQGHKATHYTASRSLTFSGLKKYNKYEIRVSGLTRRGEGPARLLTVQTDEDVPDRPPKDITAFSLGANAVQVGWSPVPPGYTNGEVLGYRVLYNDVNDMSRANSTLVSPKETHSKINGLKVNTNYSFQVLAFTAKGNGAKSETYFARTLPDPVEQTPKVDPNTGTAHSGAKVTIAVAAVFSGTVVLGAVFLMIYFVRKRRMSSNSDSGNQGCSIVPYAISSPDWIERIVTTHNHRYETLDDENVPTTTRHPLYINIGADGSLDLPPHLREIVLEFEKLYENTRYKRLHPYRRRRSLSGGADKNGNPLYDRLEREISPSATTCQGVQATPPATKEHKQHHSVDLGELRGFIGDLQGDVRSMEMTEMGNVKQRRRPRRFSVDLGQVREFIALREIKTSLKEENTALADKPEAQDASGYHNDTIC